MNGWALATELSIWILIGGSTAVFVWFLVEVLRRAGRVPDPDDDAAEDDHEGPPGAQ